MTTEELARVARECRAAQEAYFKATKQKDRSFEEETERRRLFNAARDAEKRLDRVLEEILTPQRTLF